ncbi:MAG: hypothetical protein GTO40_13320, partial [Deltaproteobacteria bacterium]|nr:hypothetical protein [Deltaproteobacteria bacterium]
MKNNLFDPDRGAAGNKAVETPLQTKTTPEEFILLGTLITSRDRKALIQVLPTSARATVRGRKATSSAKSPQAGEVRRIALGDPLGDYLLTEIEPHKVILKKGSEQLELVLDFVGRLQKLEKPQVPKIKRPEPK